jgi:hypothetical protein
MNKCVRLMVCAACALPPAVDAAQVAINGPAGSERFGFTIVPLPNGNIVIRCLTRAAWRTSARYTCIAPTAP